MAKAKSVKKKSALPPKKAGKASLTKPSKTPKKVSKKSKANRPASPSLLTSMVPKIRVRMFRQGLGDCFLVTFDVGRNERHMLIDCGTLGNAGSDVKIDDIRDHLLDLIGNRKLDVVVITHEHLDHLSGFRSKLKVLKDKVSNVWLAWTENPSDADAIALAKYREDLGVSLAMVSEASRETEVRQNIVSLLGFAGAETDESGDIRLGADFAKTVHASMEFVRTEMGPSPKYCEPGELIEVDWLPGFRIYVLGPPRSEAKLKELGNHGSKELYALHQGLRSAAGIRHALNSTKVLDATDEATQESMSSIPFDRRYHERGEDIKRERYPAYFDANEEWRTIEDDWMGIASDLALQLDNVTNNTSLVLAIERIADQKVLLFPADAQQGNWLSWHEPNIKWEVSESDGSKTEVTAAQLLSRTVFYKVGHHGSHNATMKGKGLELMKKSGELTAFIPVNRSIALGRSPKGQWKMPAKDLYRRLLEQCDGRVVRSDIGWSRKPSGEEAKVVESEFVDLATETNWKAWQSQQRSAEKAGMVSVGELYIDYLLQ